MFLLAEFVILDAAVPAWAWVGLVALAWLFVVSAAAGMTLWLLARRQASRAMKRSLIMVVLLGVVLLVGVVLLGQALAEELCLVMGFPGYGLGHA